MLGESLLTLSALAGRMVVDAAATDGWQTAEHGYAKLLGRRDATRTQLAEQWLEETRKQLAGGAGTDMEMIRTALAGRWAGRLAASPVAQRLASAGWCRSAAAGSGHVAWANPADVARHLPASPVAARPEPLGRRRR